MGRAGGIAVLVALLLWGGAGVAAEAAWRPAAPLTPLFDDLDDAAVGVGPAGDAIVLWDGHPFGSTTTSAWAATSLGQGALGPPVRLSADSADAFRPTAAVDAAGNMLAAWDRQNGGSVVESAWRLADGEFGPIDILSGASGSDQRVAVAESGQAVALFNDGGTMYARYGQVGAVFPDPPDEISTATSFAPALAIDAAGNAIATWIQGDRVVAAFRAAGGVFGAPVFISPASETAFNGAVVMNRAGEAVASWSLDKAEDEVQVAIRPPGGAFSGPDTISEPPKSASLPRLALDDAGNAVAAWEQRDADNDARIWMATRLPGGAFSAPNPVSADGVDSFFARVAAGAAGQAIVAWETGDDVVAQVRQSAGAFSAPTRISGEGPNSDPVVGMDAAGNALAVWRAREGANDWHVDGAIFDAVAPVMRDVAVPATATVGVPVEVNATPFDPWSPFTTLWSFGEGTTAAGNAASHTYAAPGAYDVAVTATDAAGNAATETRQITVEPSPPTPAPGAPPPGGVVPKVSALRIVPSAFPAAARGPSAAERHRGRAGARVSYRLNAPADVRFTVRRGASGRRVGRRCVRPTRRNRGRRRCVRYVRMRGSFTRPSTAGLNRFRFTGRLRARRLRPGRYRLIVTPRADGVRGTRRRAAFRIVRPR